jgi:hypothetical protein
MRRSSCSIKYYDDAAENIFLKLHVFLYKSESYWLCSDLERRAALVYRLAQFFCLPLHGLYSVEGE